MLYISPNEQHHLWKRDKEKKGMIELKQREAFLDSAGIKSASLKDKLMFCVFVAISVT